MKLTNFRAEQTAKTNKNSLKLFTFLTLFLISNVNVFSITGTMSAISTNCNSCSWHCLARHVCCSDGKQTVYGHASGPTTIKADELHVDPTAIGSFPRLNVYIGVEGSDFEENRGIAYFNVPTGSDTITAQMLLFHEVEDVIIYPVLYDEFMIMQEKTFAEIVAYINGSYTKTKALVYPNPTGGEAVYVKLTDDYIEAGQVTSVTYQVYNSNQTLLTTLVSDNPATPVEIPSEYIGQSGVYHINCIAEKENAALNEEFALQFIVEE